jgi:hypothetical protein
MHAFERFTKKYQLSCTLSFGDIYGQVAVWLGIVFLSLALSVGLMGSQPVIAFSLVGIVLLISLPFLLFSFVTTLFNHIEVAQIDNESLTSRPAAYQRSEKN